MAELLTKLDLWIIGVGLLFGALLIGSALLVDLWVHAGDYSESANWEEHHGPGNF